jgi:hypothetical protein
MGIEDRPIDQGNTEVRIVVNDGIEPGGSPVVVPPLKVATDGTNPLDVIVGDQTTPPLDLYFIQATGDADTLAVEGAVDDTSITLNDDTGFAVGGYIGVFSGGRFYFGEVLATPGANVLNLDTPLDFAYAVGSNVLEFSRDLGVSGSIGSPEIFEVQGPGGAAAGLEIDITRIMISMITDSAADLSLFGDIAALTNGCVLRRNDGAVRNIFNVKTNVDLLNLAYDLTIYSAANPVQGVDGLGARYTFSGPDKHGVAVRLGAGESLEWLVQDDLTDLGTATATFRVIAQGHIVED